MPGSEHLLRIRFHNAGPDPVSRGATITGYPHGEVLRLVPVTPTGCTLFYDHLDTPPPFPPFETVAMLASMVAPGASVECTVSLQVYDHARGRYDLSFWADPGFGTSDSDESNNGFDLGLVFGSPPPVPPPRVVPAVGWATSGLLFIAFCVTAHRARRL